MKEYFKIGKLVATFGVNGQMILEHNLGKKTALKGLEIIFVEESKDAFLPYFISEVKIKNDKEVYILLEGYNNKEEAHPLLKKEVWLSDSDFKKFVADASPISLLGYMIFNEDEKIGEVLEVIEQPHQVLCVIEMEGKEALIPVHADTLKNIDKKHKKIFLNLPDGLLEIYKNS